MNKGKGKNQGFEEKSGIYVDPRHEEHSLDLPFWRDNKKLWALKIPEETMNIDELKWMMEVPFWEDEKRNIVLTPNEVLKDLDHFPKHRDRILGCDTLFPLHIMKNKKGEWVTLDGLHRLAKLILEGERVVKVKKVSEEQVWLTKRNG